MPDNTKSFRQHIIRLTLVTGSTVATIIGAQSLATLDRQSALPESTPVDSAVPDTQPAVAPEAQAFPAMTATPATVSLTTAEDRPAAKAELTVVHTAPRITVLRGANGTSPVRQAAANPITQIAPPSPVEVAPPQPIVIQNTPQVIVQEIQAPPPPSSSSSSSAPAPRSSSSR